MWEEVFLVVEICWKVGVKVKMIIGDSCLIVIEIVCEIGIISEDEDNDYFIIGNKFCELDDVVVLVMV